LNNRRHSSILSPLQAGTELSGRMKHALKIRQEFFAQFVAGGMIATQGSA
jgi:hypothetical protein